MTRRSDDPRPLLDDAAVEALLRGDAVGAPDAQLAAALAELRRDSDRPVPTPSPELADLLATGLPAGRPHRVRRALVGLAAAGATTFAAAGVAAAHDVLPGPAQRVVSNIVNDFTPFDIDRPQPTPAPAPVEDHRGRGRHQDDTSPSPSRSAETDDRGGGPGPSGGSTGSGSDDSGGGKESGSGGGPGSGSGDRSGDGSGSGRDGGSDDGSDDGGRGSGGHGSDG